MQANILHEQNILQNLRYQGFILRSRTLLADVLPIQMCVYGLHCLSTNKKHYTSSFSVHFSELRSQVIIFSNFTSIIQTLVQN